MPYLKYYTILTFAWVFMLTLGVAVLVVTSPWIIWEAYLKDESRVWRRHLGLKVDY